MSLINASLITVTKSLCTKDYTAQSKQYLQMKCHISEKYNLYRFSIPAAELEGTVSWDDDDGSGHYDTLQADCQPSFRDSFCSCQDPLPLASVLCLAAKQQVAELLADSSKYIVL